MSNQRFVLDSDRISRIDATLLYVSTSKYEGDWHSILHTHYFTELFYVTKGKGDFVVEDKAFPVKEQDLVIINPNVAHTEKSYLSNPLEYIAVGIDGLGFSSKEEGVSATHHVLHFREQREELDFCLRMLLQEAETTLPYREAICQDLLDMILIILLRQTNFTLSVISSKRASLACGIAKRHIDTHYKEPITLQSLAELTHVSKFYLAHSFTQDYGMSPINYLIAKRIEESQNLLRSTDHSIAQVASFTGFSSQSYFSQSFKKITGLSPGEYRQTARQHKQSSRNDENRG